jgi:DNA polymerase
MRILEADFETFGTVDLSGQESVGIYNYCSHPDTRVLMLGYKLPGDTNRKLWEPALGPMSPELRAALLDPTVFILAYNSAFERYIFQFKCGITIPASRFIDPQVSSRYLSMPGKLEMDCKILDMPPELAKDARGEELIDLFCMPHAIKKKKGVAEHTVVYDWTTHPTEWEEFGRYCLQDLVAEAELLRRQEILQAYPLPPFERKLWEFDQKVNDRGWPVDVDFVRKAYKLAVRSKQEALDRQNKITGLENANSTDQLKPWLKARGYPFNTLRKETVDSVLKDPDVKLTQEAREVLVARREASSTSYQKLAAVLQRVSPDGRLHGLFVFMGSARAGRWAGAGVQPHNFPRPAVVGEVKDKDGNIIEKGYDFEDLDVVREARQLIYDEKYDEIKAKYKSVLLVIKSVLRTIFVAPQGTRFQAADLNAIETRDGAWLAGCAELMDVFKPWVDPRGKLKPNGKCPYLNFGSTKMYGMPFEAMYSDYEGWNGKERKNAAKRMRQISKPAVLAAIFRQSGGGWGYAKKGYKDHGDDCNANETYIEQNGKVKKVGKKYCVCPTIHDKIKTGLWGYAEGMGVEMPQDQAVQSVRIFRESYKEIEQCWYDIENAVADVMKGQNTVRTIGPNGCVVIDKIIVNNSREIMRMRLPSGRYLHYLDARMEDCLMPWKKDGEDVYRPSLIYAGVNQDTKQWETVQTHGGKLYENLVQAIARDILATKLLEFEANDLPVVGHVHDEGVCLVPDDIFSPTVESMVEIMSKQISWAPGLLLGADGFSDEFYHK